MDDVVKEVDQGADVNASNIGVLRGSPIRISIHNGHVVIVRFLVSRGANLSNLLVWHVIWGNVEMIPVLISEFGVDVNATNTDGRSALHTAAGSRRLDVMKVLASHGANLHAVDKNGYNAISAMCEDLYGEGDNEVS